MQINIRLVYTALATLLVCNIIRLLLRRRIYARQLPPRYFTWDPIYNFDWTFSTALDGRNYLRLQEKYGKTYRLSTITNSLSAVVTSDVDNCNAIMWSADWGVGWRYTGMKEMLGRGFLTTDGDEWMRGRKMLKPSFNKSNIDSFGTLEKVTDELLLQIEERNGEADMGKLLFDAVS
jgi:cytochrome P450